MWKILSNSSRWTRPCSSSRLCCRRGSRRTRNSSKLTSKSYLVTQKCLNQTNKITVNSTRVVSAAEWEKVAVNQIISIKIVGTRRRSSSSSGAIYSHRLSRTLEWWSLAKKASATLVINSFKKFGKRNGALHLLVVILEARVSMERNFRTKEFTINFLSRAWLRAIITDQTPIAALLWLRSHQLTPPLPSTSNIRY